jgi:hypothetical protein
MRRIESILGGGRSVELDLEEERTGKRRVLGRSGTVGDGRRSEARRLRGRECHRAGGGGGDSPHRACMCRRSAGKVNFLRKFIALLVLSLVYNTGCKEDSVRRPTSVENDVLSMADRPRGESH